LPFSFADGSKWTTHGDGAGLFVPDVGVGVVVVGRDAASVADLAVGVVEGVEVVDTCSFRFGVHGPQIRVLKVVPGEDCATESVAGGGVVDLVCVLMLVHSMMKWLLMLLRVQQIAAIAQLDQIHAWGGLPPLLP